MFHPCSQHQWARAQCVHGQLRTCSLRLVWFSMACAFPDHNCSSETAGRVGPQSCRNLSIRSTAEQWTRPPKGCHSATFLFVFTELAVADQGHRSQGFSWALEGKDPRSGDPWEVWPLGRPGDRWDSCATVAGRRGLRPLPRRRRPGAQGQRGKDQTTWSHLRPSCVQGMLKDSGASDPELPSPWTQRSLPRRSCSSGSCCLVTRAEAKEAARTWQEHRAVKEASGSLGPVLARVEQDVCAESRPEIQQSQGRGWPAGRWRRLAGGLGLTLPPPSEEAGQLPLALPAFLQWPVALARRWLWESGGAAAGSPPWRRHV